MKSITFAFRCSKEIMRDPINVAFGAGFPLILLFLLSAIQSRIPVSLFQIESLVPGIAAFGLSFISLFSGILIAKDRSSSFLIRLLASPLSAADFILGYTLPLLPLAVLQSLICYGAAVFLGLKITVNAAAAILVLIPTAVLFIAIGLLAGSLLTDKQVGGVCGALLTNLCAWLSGTWFDLKLVGGFFETAANLLPFVHGVEAGKTALAGNFELVFSHLLWVIAYAVVILFLAIFIFNKRMRGDSK